MSGVAGVTRCARCGAEAREQWAVRLPSGHLTVRLGRCRVCGFYGGWPG